MHGLLKHLRADQLRQRPMVMHLAPGQWAGHMRIFHRQCTALAEAGYPVKLVAHLLAGETLDPKITVYTLGAYTNPSLAWSLFKRLRRSQRVYDLARRSDAALYQYYSPEFILWGRRLRSATRRPVIFDCMEDFEGYVRQRRGIPNVLRRPLRLFVRQQLQLAAHSCDAVIVADQGTANTLRPYARRVLTLHNFPRFALFSDLQPTSTEKPYDIVYHGSIPRYHLEVCLAIDAVLVERGYHLSWRFIGRLPEIDWFTRELGLRDICNRFSISGLIPHDQIAREVVKAKIGLIPLPNLPKFQNNIPQKLFEFMALGLPVVMSDLPPSRPFIGDGACGFLVPWDDYHAYADAIIRLLKDPALCRQMGAEGRGRVIREYNWERESQKLIDLYRELLGT
jgi:glycosyltransferase involved in cell wall biosynthesis